MVIGNEGKLTEVMWEGLAYQKGLTVGTQIVAVDETSYDADRLEGAIKAAKKSAASIELFVKNGDRYRTVRIDYHDGLRYPRLERNASVSARLDDILAARN